MCNATCFYVLISFRLLVSSMSSSPFCISSRWRAWKREKVSLQYKKNFNEKLRYSTSRRIRPNQTLWYLLQLTVEQVVAKQYNSAPASQRVVSTRHVRHKKRQKFYWTQGRLESDSGFDICYNWLSFICIMSSRTWWFLYGMFLRIGQKAKWLKLQR